MEKTKTTTAKSTAKKSATKKTTKSSASSKAPKTTSTGKIKPKTDAADDLLSFFEDGLKDMYWAEKNLLKALKKMDKNATSAKLKEAIQTHYSQTERQVTMLEEVFATIGKKPKAVKCDAMEGLIKEGEGIMEETEPGAVRDAAIIAAAQKVEHYEIASYGTLATYAKLLGNEEGKNLLGAILEEEKTTDELLTELAVSEINLDAQ